MNALVEINRYLDRWLIRYRSQRSIAWAIRGLLVGLACAGLVAWWVVPRDLLLLTQFISVTIGIILSSLILTGLAGFLWPIKRFEAIRFFDRRFNLQERISTAVEFSNQANPANTLLETQQQDALEHARRVDLKESLPWKISWLELGAALVMILMIAGLTVRSQPHFLAAWQKQNLIKRIQEQAASLEELRSNIQKLEKLTPEQREELEGPLKEAASKLESAQSLEQALSALNQAEEELRALAPAELQNQASGLQQAGEAIRAHEGSALATFGENLAQGNFSQAAQELNSLNPAGLNEDQKNQLASDLQAASEALAGTNIDLAQDLEAAAEALRAGEADGAGQALSQAAQNLGARAGELAIASSAGQIAAQLSASQQNLAQAGSPGQAQMSGSNLQANSGNPASSGQSDGQTNGQGSAGGQGSGGNLSDSGSSGGAGQGESQGGENNGSQAGSQPIDTSNQPGNGGERLYESIYAPQRLDNQAGQDVQLPGSGQPGQVIGQAGQSPGASGENLIPYTEVFPAYESVIRQAIESGQVPQHLQALVRDYFSSLAP